MKRYREAVDQGLLKIMSKMGIAVDLVAIAAAYNFEAIGLSRTLVAEYLPRHALAHLGHRPDRHPAQGAGACTSAPGARTSQPLPVGGFYQLPRAAARAHACEANLIHMLQSAVASESYQTFKKFSEAMAQAAADRHPRPAWPSRRRAAAFPLDEVESITEIRKRFVTPGMSLGALSPEAHETLNIAMNRIGAKSDSRRGRRGPGALPAPAQRRQRQLGHQAGRLGPVRRHRRISQQLPRAGDQDRPGRQARRRRPASGLQGDGGDRAGCATRRAGVIADLARRPITTSIRSRIWPSSSTT